MDFGEFKNGEPPEMSLTLKYLLENPSLLQPPETGDCKEKCKDDDQFELSQQSDLTSAYLGPQIWSDMLLSDDLKLEPVELDELLQTSGVDDEMSDLGLLMSSTPTVSPEERFKHRSSVSEDPNVVNYQDMPSLMSTGVPDARQVPSPSDYFQPSSSLSQQVTSKTQSSPIQQSGHRMALHYQQQIQQCHQLGGPQNSQQQKLLEQQLCDQQFAIFSDIMASNQYKSPPRQPQQAVSMPQPPQQLPQPQQTVAVKRTRQMSTNVITQQVLQSASAPQPHHSQPVYTQPQTQQISRTVRKRPSTTTNTTTEGPPEKETRYSPISSPLSPIEVRIPSPKKVNFVPNSTDVIISTPQLYSTDASFDENSEPDLVFDPSTRRFTEDELKPQPIIRKSKKVHVPPDNKDGKYWSRRSKNNVAAKRSREARRIKENQIAMRANYLEQENSVLKTEVAELRKELTRVIEVVRKYEKMFPNLHE